MGALVDFHMQVDAELMAQAKAELEARGSSVVEAVQEMLEQTVGSQEAIDPKEHPAYDAWFRAKVQEALDDPRPGIPHEEVVRRMEVRLAELEAHSR